MAFLMSVVSKKRDDIQVFRPLLQSGLNLKQTFARWCLHQSTRQSEPQFIAGNGRNKQSTFINRRYVFNKHRIAPVKQM